MFRSFFVCNSFPQKHSQANSSLSSRFHNKNFFLLFWMFRGSFRHLNLSHRAALEKLFFPFNKKLTGCDLAAYPFKDALNEVTAPDCSVLLNRAVGGRSVLEDFFLILLTGFDIGSVGNWDSFNRNSILEIPFFFRDALSESCWHFALWFSSKCVSLLSDFEAFYASFSRPFSSCFSVQIFSVRPYLFIFF